MNKALKTRKAKAGLLLIASPRFKNLYGPKRGTYGERKDAAVKQIKATMGFMDLVDPGIVYEREDAQRAMDLFYNEKVDFIYAEFLSWSEDFAWIRFLRDCPEIPILFCNVAKPRMTFETTLDEDDFVDYLCAGTLVGSLEGSGDVVRTGRKNVKTIMGTREQITEKVKVFAGAARVRSILRHSNVGLMANMNEAMWSTYIDNYDLFTKIGPEIHYLPYSDYGAEIENLADEEVKAYADELTSRYKMMDDVEYDKFIGCVKATLGIKNLAVTSDGETYDNPKSYEKNQARLKRLQRQLSRKPKDSKNREKNRKKIAKLHQHIRNQRKDATHKMTHDLIKKYDCICIEDLRPSETVKDKRLSKAISDANFGEIRRQLEYKSAWHQKQLIVADRWFPSSQTCYKCGYQNRAVKNLGIRYRTCPHCKTEHDRDTNAAINILHEGLKREKLIQKVL